jgi:hypothetical protein
MTFYFVIVLLALWRAVKSIQHHIDQAINLIRQQRNEDLRWHRDSLLSHIRADAAQRR